jgi:hypothetical protein
LDSAAAMVSRPTLYRLRRVRNQWRTVSSCESNCRIAVKWQSRAISVASCSMASAAVQRSLIGIGVASFYKCTNSRAYCSAVSRPGVNAFISASSTPAIAIDLPLRAQYFVERGIGLPLADKMRKVSFGRHGHRGMSQLLHQQLVQTYAPFSGLVAKRSIDFRGDAAHTILNAFCLHWLAFDASRECRHSSAIPQSSNAWHRRLSSGDLRFCSSALCATPECDLAIGAP